MRLTLRTVLPLALLVMASCGGPFPQSSLDPRSDFASEIDSLFDGIMILATAVFIVVEVLLLVTIVRFRRREGGPEPRRIFGHTGLEIGWTMAPAFVLVLIAVPTIRSVFRTASRPAGDVLVVEAIGKQWWWEFRYPELGVVTANELHLPVNQTVEVAITSTDVIHSFWVPRLGGKRDAIGGRTNRIFFRPDSIGEYLGQCAEFCGVSHANMRFRVYVDEPGAFDAWVARQRDVPVEADSGSLAAQGKTVYSTSACIGCHTVEGVSAGAVGPNFTHFGGRRTIGSAVFDNSAEQLAAWIRNAPAMKPGVLMPPLELADDQIAALVAYLHSLQ
jgi:cytochrome c oxidase subunit 2